MRPVNGQAHAARDRLLLVFGVGDHLQAGDAQVDSLCRELSSELRARPDSAPPRRAAGRHRQRCLPRCAAGRRRAPPARARAPDAAPSRRTMHPAAATARPTAARRCAAREEPPRRRAPLSTRAPPAPGWGADRVAAWPQSRQQRARPHERAGPERAGAWSAEPKDLKRLLDGGRVGFHRA